MSVSDSSNPMKRSLFVALAFGALAVVLYMFGVRPCQTAVRRAREDLSAMEDRQRVMAMDLKGAEQLKVRLGDVTSGRQRFLDGLLMPLLESYAMRAKAVLDPLAADVNLKITDYAELPVRALPLPKPLSPQLYARKPIRVTCTGTYGEIISFLLRVEKMCPLVSLEAFSLKVKNEPDRQSAEFVFEWPVLGVNTAAKGGAKK